MTYSKLAPRVANRHTEGPSGTPRAPLRPGAGGIGNGLEGLADHFLYLPAPGRTGAARPLCVPIRHPRSPWE